jgi:hypothetical protein
MKFALPTVLIYGLGLLSGLASATDLQPNLRSTEPTASINALAQSISAREQINWDRTPNLYASTSIKLAADSSTASDNETESTEKKEVLVEFKGDIDRDGQQDRVLLIPADDLGTLDLAVYLSSEKRSKDKPSAYIKAFSWGYDMSMPNVSLTDKGSLTLEFANHDMGRNRWGTKFTIVYRQNKLLVAGYTHHEYDTLDPKNEASCDINLLTGKGVSNGKNVKIPAGGVELIHWDDTKISKHCRSKQ